MGARRQRDNGRGGVALAGAQWRAVAVYDRADLRGAARDEARVGADPDVVQPALGASPDGSARVLHRPGDGGVFAREVVGQCGDAGHAQVGRCIADHRHRTVDVVVFGHLGHIVAAGVAVAGIGLHHQVAAADRRAQGHALADGVALVVAQYTLLLDLANQPDHLGLGRVGVVHQPDLVGPGAFVGIAPVLDAVAEAVVARRADAGIGRGRRDHAADHQIGRCDAQHADRPRFVVVVVDLGRIVGVDVAGQGVFQDGVVQVAPDGDVVLATAHTIGDLCVDGAQVILADGKVAGVGGLADPDVALAGVGPGLVDREPDRIGPAVGAGRITARGGRPLVGDGVIDLDAGAMHRLVGCHHLAGDQIGKRNRVDMKALGAGVVAFAGVLVDAAAAVGHHDQVGITPVADRDVDVGHIGAVGLTGAEGRAAVYPRQQYIVTADDAVQRQVHIVLPLAAGGLGAGIGDGKAQAGAGAGGDGRRRGDGGHAQVGPVVQADDQRIAVGGGVVVAGRAKLIDLRAATAAQQAVGDHAQAVAALDLAGQANLLGAGIADAGVQPPVVGEGAQHHG